MSLSPADLSLLSRLLDEALDAPPAQAEAWLAALPEAHRHLLPQLHEMLAEHSSQRHGGFMSDGPKLVGVRSTKRSLGPTNSSAHTG